MPFCTCAPKAIPSPPRPRMPRTARRPMGFSPCSGVQGLLLDVTSPHGSRSGPDLAVFIAHHPLRRPAWRFDCAGSQTELRARKANGTPGPVREANITGRGRFGPGGMATGRRALTTPVPLVLPSAPSHTLETLPPRDWCAGRAAPQMKLR